MPVRVNAGAKAEARAAARFLESKRAGYGAVFRAALDTTLGRISDEPELYPSINERYRRAVLHRFPYLVVYRIRAEHVEVVCLFPCHSNPGRLEALTQHS